MNSRPSREEVLMQVAELFSARSTCSRASVGAILAREGRILATGYNGAPTGMAHCDHRVPELPAGCTTAVHAEANAIAYAARYGISLEGSELFTTLMPCLSCAQLIINAGVWRMYVKTLYRDEAGRKLISAAGIDIIIL